MKESEKNVKFLEKIYNRYIKTELFNSIEGLGLFMFMSSFLKRTNVDENKVFLKLDEIASLNLEKEDLK